MLFVLAWRNIWRNRKRTILTFSTMALGISFLIYLNSLNNWYYQRSIELVIEGDKGHIQIHKKGYYEKMKNINITNKEKILNILKKNNEIKSIAPRVVINCYLSTPSSSTGAVLYGIDKKNEFIIKNLKEKITEGNLGFKNNKMNKSIVIGKAMAEELEVGIGDKLILMTQGKDNIMSSEVLRVGGIMDLNSRFLNLSFALIDLKNLQEILGYFPEEITEISILLKKSGQEEKVIKNLETSLTGFGLDYKTWEELLPGIVKSINVNKFLILVLSVIFISTVNLGIVNVLLMSIFERTREFGVMMALGTKASNIIILVILEAVFLAFLSIAAGVAIGSFISLNPGIVDLIANVGEASQIEQSGALLSLKSVCLLSLLVFIISVIFSFYPAWRASKLEPVKALRHI